MFVGFLLLGMYLSSLISVGLSFIKKKSIRILSAILGIPGAFIAVMLVSDLSTLNTNTALIASIPLVAYAITLYNLIKWFRDNK